jgi:threonine/homoserine/homoserine lactone efflux protein
MIKTLLHSSWVHYLFLGLLISAVITDADGQRLAGFVIVAVAAAFLCWLAWQLLRSRAPSRDQVRGTVMKLESDPDTQYKIHRIGVIYWLINFPIVAWLFFFHRSFWEQVGIFITLVYSVYANLATDYGAMSSAMAAKGLQPPPEIPLQPDE